METVFITGADGYAGNLLTQQLRQRGYGVVAGVRNRARKLVHERQYGKALVCDVSDAINVARAVASVGPNAVVHLASVAHAWTADEQPLVAYQSIVTAWANVLDAVRRTCPRARVLLVSACDVYGNAGRDGRPLSEDVTPEPASTFGSLKLSAESIAHTYYDRFHLNLTIARPFHYTGPGQPEGFFFSAAAKRLAEWNQDGAGEELSLPDLSCRRDVLHVQDVVDAYERLLLDGQPNEVYNVCSGSARTCQELVETMARAARLNVRLVEEPADSEYEQIPVLCGDNTKLRTQLGWQPTHTIDRALQDLMRSHEQQAAARLG